MSQNIKTLRISGIELPIPTNWELSDNNRSYVGASGILDPRVAPLHSIDETRLIDVRQRQLDIADGDVIAEITQIQGRKCLRCSYQRGGVIVLTYTFQVNEESELNATYGIQPGCEEVCDAITGMLQ